MGASHHSDVALTGAKVRIDGDDPFRFPALPRMELGRYTLLPQYDRAGNVIEDKWVLPGRQVLTTEQCQALAARNDWSIRIIVN